MGMRIATRLTKTKYREWFCNGLRHRSDRDAHGRLLPASIVLGVRYQGLFDADEDLYFLDGVEVSSTGGPPPYRYF